MQTYNAVLSIYCIAIMLGASLVGALADWLLIILAGEQYLAGSSVVYALCAGLAIQSVGWISGVGIDIKKKSYLRLISYVSSLAITILLALLLVDDHGIWGVAVSVAAGYIIRAVLDTALGQTAYLMAWEYRIPALVFAISLTTGILFSRTGVIVYWAQAAILSIALGATLTRLYQRHVTRRE